MGWPPCKRVCVVCPDRKRCIAHRGERGRGQALAPHSLVPWIEDPPAGIVYDELPPLLDRLEMTDSTACTSHPAMGAESGKGR